MTAKDKAKELMDRFEKLDSAHATDSPIGSYYHDQKQCAIICVDEMLEVLNDMAADTDIYVDDYITYWEELKLEIEKP